MKSIIKLFAPNLAWARQYNLDTARHDAVAGFVSSLIMIPQAAALASLAGMPPQYGIYASIVPVIVAALWGSSRHALSGPNTAVAMMISAAIFPFANLGTDLYIGHVLTLTFIVGLIQLAMAGFKFGSLLKFVSPAVITGITNAVGVLIIVSAGWGLLGVHNMMEWHFLTRLNQLVHDVPLANPYAVGVGLFTLVIGFSSKLIARRYYLVIAMFAGIGFSWLLNWLLGSETTGIEVLGNLSINFLQFSIPNTDIEAVYVLQHLLLAGLAIAIVGALQATVIVRAIADRSGQAIDKNKELAGQGMSNLVGSFFLSFAGSSSFNRSIVHYQAGAKTPVAAIISALLLVVFVFLGEAIISTMPIAVMSAVLIMVGWGLIDFREFHRIFHLRSEAIIFYLTIIAALMFGLTDAVFLGIVASLYVYLRGVINPNVTSMVEAYGTRHVLQLRGHLFFGTLTHLSNHVRRLMQSENKKATLVIDLREVTYIDWAAVRLLRRIGQEWRNNGGKFVLRVLENQQDKTLGLIDQISKIGGERQVA
ncbi:MAG: STAS domain-containing protein [Gammaproteobacteria bacterium]|nr:STAS domain-containing protein [Gammaproteobacteria bacterium]